jgi:hypothetical protein
MKIFYCFLILISFLINISYSATVCFYSDSCTTSIGCTTNTGDFSLGGSIHNCNGDGGINYFTFNFYPNNPTLGYFYFQAVNGNYWSYYNYYV